MLALEIQEIEWRELRDRYRRIIASEGKAELPEQGGALHWLAGQWRDPDPEQREWSGATSREVLDWCKHGFHVPRLPMATRPAALESHRPKWRWSDDPARGTYQHEAGMTGDPMCYLARDRRRSTAGIRVEVGIAFVSSTPARVVAEYGAWVGSALKALEASGYDLEVSVITDAEGIYNRKHYRAKVRCSGFGERTMFRDWSALFSPGGWRHLLFLALCWPEYDSEHDRADPSLGNAAFWSDWQLDFEPATRTLTITPHYGASRFDGERMRELWDEALALA